MSDYFSRRVAPGRGKFAYVLNHGKSKARGQLYVHCRQIGYVYLRLIAHI